MLSLACQESVLPEGPAAKAPKQPSSKKQNKEDKVARSFGKTTDVVKCWQEVEPL